MEAWKSTEIDKNRTHKAGNREKTTHKCNNSKQKKAEYTGFTNPCTPHTAP